MSNPTAIPGLVPVTIVVTETSSIFLNHRANALKCSHCDKIVAIEVYEHGSFIMKMIDAVKKQTTAG